MNSVYLLGLQIHNGPLQPFSQDFGLASHTTHVLCVNIIHKWRDLAFNVESERQKHKKLSMAILFTLNFCQKSAERKSQWNIFHISFLMIDLGYESGLLKIISRNTTYQTTATFNMYLFMFFSSKINIRILSKYCTKHFANQTFAQNSYSKY